MSTNKVKTELYQTDPRLGGSLSELLNLYHVSKSCHFPPRQRVATIGPGAYQSTIRGRGIDFDEVRIYQSGDDIRLVDWRVTARTGKPHTKIFCEEKERPVFLLVDQSASMQFGSKITFKSIIAATAAAFIAWVATHHNDRVGAFIFQNQHHCEFKPKARRQGILPILQTLADTCQPQQLPPTNEENIFEKTLFRLRHVARPGSLIFILSDFYQFSEIAQQHIAQLTAHCDVKTALIYDILEYQAPLPAQYQVTNGKEKLLLNTQNQHVSDSYNTFFQQRIDSIKQKLQQLKVPVKSLATDCNLVTTMQHALRQWSDDGDTQWR